MTVDAQFSQGFTQKSFETLPFFPTGVRSLLRFLVMPAYRQSLRTGTGDIERVVFAGGGLFAIKFSAYFLWFLMFLWVRWYMPRAEIRFEHQGVDTPPNYLSKKIVQYVFTRIDFLSVRDEASVVNVRNLLGKEIPLMGDRVEKFLQSQKTDKTPHKVLLLNALRPVEIEILKKKLEPFFEYEILGVALDPLDARVFPDIYPVVFPQTQAELIQLFQKAEYAIGERFHFLLLATYCMNSDKIFTLRKPYAQKVQQFCDTHTISPF